MHRRPAHRRNFYEEEEEEVQTVKGTAAISSDADETEVLPQPYDTIWPTARYPARTSSSGSDSGSSASIEDVIPWSVSLSHAKDARLPGEVEYVSLQQLQDSVEEAKRDIRRLRALMVKAVWHALTKPADEEQRGKTTARQRETTATAGSRTLQRQTKTGGGHHVMGETTRLFSSLTASDSSGFFNEKPFLPPDRYPTLPPLTERTDHFHVNLSRALSAAHRAGLLEKQRVWMQHRQSSSLLKNTSASTSGSTASASGPSTRKTALQRISTLSTTSTAAAAKPQKQRSESGVGVSQQAAETARPADEIKKEERVASSVSLVILRVAKDRAVAALFLRQLRLDTYRRHLLRENVSLRYSYYVQRRVLRNWLMAAQQQHAWRTQILRKIVTHWQLYVQYKRALHEHLRGWRQQLRHRATAFATCRRAQLTRCWHQWVRAFAWHRERNGLYEAAAQFATSHRHTTIFDGLCGAADSHGWESDLLAILHGSPVVARRGGVVATPVGHRLALQRLFQAWKVRTERRLMTHLATWQRAQSLRRHVVRRACARARVLALRAHRQRNEMQLLRSPVALEEAVGTPTVAAPLSPPPRAPVRVFAATAARQELLKFQVSTASCIAHAAQLCRCFRRWRTRLQTRCADVHRRQCLRTHVMRRWLHALTANHQQREWKALVLGRWVVAVQHRHDAAAAAQRHLFAVLHHVFSLWRAHFTLRVDGAERTRRRCLQRWWEKAVLHAGMRTLRQMKLRRLLRQWHTRAQTRTNTRAHLCVAETLFETGLLLGCVRQWRSRAAEHRRIRLAWEVFVQLRCERVCRRCFEVWQRRAFGPAAVAPLPPQVYWQRRTTSSLPSSLLASHLP
jgi:hypothetical protein